MLLAIELVFTGLLVLAGIAIAGISAVVLYKLFKGQR
jgi:xanthine/uracil permease